MQVKLCLTSGHASQVDTKDILFICGGAFIDLDRQVSERTHEASLGFGNPVRHALRAMTHTMTHTPWCRGAAVCASWCR